MQMWGRLLVVFTLLGGFAEVTSSCVDYPNASSSLADTCVLSSSEALPSEPLVPVDISKNSTENVTADEDAQAALGAEMVVLYLRSRLGEFVTQYEQAFIDKGVSQNVFLHLSESDLREWLGITVDAHRALFQEAIEELRAEVEHTHPENFWQWCALDRRKCHLLLLGFSLCPRITAGVLWALRDEEPFRAVVEAFVPQDSKFKLAFFWGSYTMQPHVTVFFGGLKYWPRHPWLFTWLLCCIMSGSAVPYPQTEPLQILVTWLKLTFYYCIFPLVPLPVQHGVLWLVAMRPLINAILTLRIRMQFTNTREIRMPPPLKVPAQLEDYPGHVPKHFICPISQSIMSLPAIVASSGISYDYEHIRNWLKHNETEPSTREAANQFELAPNRTLYAEIDEWLQSWERRFKRRQRRARRDSNGMLRLCNYIGGYTPVREDEVTWLEWAFGPPESDGEDAEFEVMEVSGREADSEVSSCSAEEDSSGEEDEGPSGGEGEEGLEDINELEARIYATDSGLDSEVDSVLGRLCA